MHTFTHQENLPINQKERNPLTQPVSQDLEDHPTYKFSLLHIIADHFLITHGFYDLLYSFFPFLDGVKNQTCRNLQLPAEK